MTKKTSKTAAPKDHTERDANILKWRAKGVSVKSISKTFKMTESAVYQVLQRQKKLARQAARAAKATVRPPAPKQSIDGLTLQDLAKRVRATHPMSQRVIVDFEAGSIIIESLTEETFALRS